jgi:hypothetical protein
MNKISRSDMARIKKRPYYAFLYAKNILKGRLPENLEASLTGDPQSSYLYAKHVLKGPLPDPLYAALMIGTWSKEDREYISKYLKEFPEKKVGAR